LKHAFHAEETVRWMQAMAAESHVPVSAFLVHLRDADYAIRWFTPTKELELCGHGTITASHVLYEELCEVPRDCAIRFHTTHSGVVSAVTGHDVMPVPPSAVSSQARIFLDFPNTRLTAHSLSPEDKAHFASAMRLSAASLDEHVLFCGQSVYDVVLHVSPELFAQLPHDIDFSALRRVETPRGILVTTSDGGGDAPAASAAAPTAAFDFRHRMFLPRFGINEDHVSGSGFCALTEYWQRTLRRPPHGVLHGHQQSPRGGSVLLQILPDDADVIRLGGHCVTTKTGALRVRPRADPLR
jgi:PhzF family phenazine biosynthesis protein